MKYENRAVLLGAIEEQLHHDTGVPDAPAHVGACRRTIAITCAGAGNATLQLFAYRFRPLNTMRAHGRLSCRIVAFRPIGLHQIRAQRTLGA